MIHYMIQIGKIMIYAVFIVFMGCNLPIKKEDLYGTFVMKNRKNTIDTLYLLKDGKYYQKLYRKDGVLVYKGGGEWSLDGCCRIDLKNFFYTHYDRIYKENYYLSKEALISTSLPVVKGFNKIKIDISSDLDFYYLKLTPDAASLSK